jgi:GTP-binding protein YchF
MQIGLVGLQYSGKSTLFHTLAKGHESESAMYPDKANISTVKVPDERLDKLTAIFNPQKKINATIEIYDVPGLKLGEDGKMKITSEFLNNVRNNDALFYVVRQFEDLGVSHPLGKIDPVRDIQYLETEFLLSDMGMLENRLEKLKKEILKTKSDQPKRELPLIERCLRQTESEYPLRLIEFDPSELKILSSYQFLTVKPLIVGINFDENSVAKVNEVINNITDGLEKYPIKVIPFFAQIEYEISSMKEEDAKEFMDSYGIKDSALHKILRSSYEVLGLQSFFTVGEDECRAWTIKTNTNAQEAAGVIHTDFYNKFIRAEVVHYDEFIQHGSFAKCKDAGCWRLEGKEYIVRDGDILNIRHN